MSCVVSQVITQISAGKSWSAALTANGDVYTWGEQTVYMKASVCVYVCMYVYACIHVCVCMHACMHVWHICMHVCICMYVCIYLYVMNIIFILHYMCGSMSYIN